MIDATMPFIRQLRALVSKPELRGLVHDLRTTVPALTKLQDRTQPLLEQVRSASSCQNEVILPWMKLTVPDKTFPAKGNVLTEAPQWLPGISNESTSGDANGQWFRVLAGGGTNMYGLGNGLVGNTLLPIQGETPRKPLNRPDIRPNAPCENQQLPDLRTDSGPAPKPVKVPLTPELLDALKAAQNEAAAGLSALSAILGYDLNVVPPLSQANPTLEDLLGSVSLARRSAKSKNAKGDQAEAPKMTKAEALKFLHNWYKDPEAARKKAQQETEQQQAEKKAVGK